MYLNKNVYFVKQISYFPESLDIEAFMSSQLIAFIKRFLMSNID